MNTPEMNDMKKQAESLVNEVYECNLLLLEAELEPVDGPRARFQPTSFPDLGPALYERPRDDGGTQTCLLVESEASMANHLENLLWDEEKNEPKDFVKCLPYVRVIRVVDGSEQFLTSSRLEAHRLASAYIMDGESRGQGRKGEEEVLERLDLPRRPTKQERREGQGKQQQAQVQPEPLKWKQIYEGIFKLDPLCLLHGVFFSRPSFPHNPKVPRALRAYIEAEGVREVNYGGVKRDHVLPALGQRTKPQEGYGFIPHARQEFTAEAIRARFLLDVGAIKRYGLGDEASRLLIALALYEVSAFLTQQPIHLRTNCRLLFRRLEPCTFKPAENSQGTEQTIGEWTEEPSRFVPGLERVINDLAEAVCKKMNISWKESPLTLVWKEPEPRKKAQEAKGQEGAVSAEESEEAESEG